MLPLVPGNIERYKLYSNPTLHVLFPLKSLEVNQVIDGNLYYTILSKNSRVGMGSDNISWIEDENTKVWFETGLIKFLSV